jgi:hypothetical protein
MRDRKAQQQTSQPDRVEFQDSGKKQKAETLKPEGGNRNAKTREVKKQGSSNRKLGRATGRR